MKHRMLRYAEGWEWHMLTSGRADDISGGSDAQAAADAGRPDTGDAPVPAPEATNLLEIKRILPACADWLDACLDRNEAQVTVTELSGGNEALHGTLMLRLSEDQHDVTPFHYWMTADRLVTFQRDLRFALRLQRSPWEDKLQRAASAPEAFAVVLSAALDPFHDGLDAFERRLGELEDAMNGRNRSVFTDIIFRRRHELLHWSHSFIGVKETEGALAEAFAAKLRDSEGYRKLVLRLARIETVIGHYAGEIDTLISMDEAITTLRGNDIIKTLTIVTVLFAPATVAGAFWGMNFATLPWAHEPWGFAALLGAVIAATACIYLWLKRRGWTGDLLDGRVGREFRPRGKRKGRAARTGGIARPEDGSRATRGPSADHASDDAGLPSRSARRLNRGEL